MLLQYEKCMENQFFFIYGKNLQLKRQIKTHNRVFNFWHFSDIKLLFSILNKNISSKINHKIFDAKCLHILLKSAKKQISIILKIILKCNLFQDSLILYMPLNVATIIIIKGLFLLNSTVTDHIYKILFYNQSLGRTMFQGIKL